LNDAPILVLWYDERYRLLQKNVKNLPNNPMQYRDFTEVYLEPVAAKGTSQQP
jgi:oligopeptide transport system substrate-binding protein